MIKMDNLYDYRNDMIDGNLIIGGIKDANNPKYLSKYNIGCVVNCAQELTNAIRYKGIKYLSLPLRDSRNQCFLKLLIKALDFMKNNSDRNILIHCQMGISRSVSITLAHMICNRGYTFKDAMREVKKKRKQAYPNESFKVQLKMLTPGVPYAHKASTCWGCIIRKGGQIPNYDPD
jgi:hypothetical protein